MKMHIHISGLDRSIQATRIAGKLSPAERKILAAEAANFTRRHFRDRDATHPHRYPAGGRRSHYWQQAARATSWRVVGEAIEVIVAHTGVSLHYHGGAILPVKARALAIPAHAAAYGRLPADFGGNLQLVVFKKSNRAALIGNGKSLPAEPFFWLVKSVHLRANPEVLPKGAEYHTALIARLDKMRSRPDNP